MTSELVLLCILSWGIVPTVMGEAWEKQIKKEKHDRTTKILNRVGRIVCIVRL
jgi:hypothetical protein